MPLKLTLGHQDFRRIRDDGLAYVDKTREVCRMAESGTYFFLSRPRRFGKSLTVSTLAELHSGDRELFRGLYAYEHWDFARKHSAVIWLQFASADVGAADTATTLHGMLERNAERLGLPLPARDEAAVGTRFRRLIEAAAAASPSGRAVVLVDEYDKPLTRFIEAGDGRVDPAIHEALGALKQFYGILKDANPFLELVFITGVSAFSKVSLFSDLNNLTNLTLHPLAAQIVGLTETELLSHFGDELEATGQPLEAVRAQYNGYRFSRLETRVYNPWSVLTFLFNGTLENFWYATGTPTWLARLVVREERFALERRGFDAHALTRFDIERLDTTAVLFQTGYLTVREYRPRSARYFLGYPNAEVAQSFSFALLGALTEAPPSHSRSVAFDVVDALEEGRVQTLVTELDALLASIPYPLWDARKESAYHVAAHALLTGMGARPQSEVASAHGRADLVLEAGDYVYGFEFKVGGEVAAALAQVRERQYLAAFAKTGRRALAVGVVFDPERRCVGDWAAEAVTPVLD